MNKNVTFIDNKGTKHKLNREQFNKLMEKLAKRAKVAHNMKVIEESKVED